MQTTTLSDTAEREVFPGFFGRFVHGESVTLAYWHIRAGSPLPPHAHPQEQVVNLLEGEFELTVDGETQALRGGDVAVIPPDAPHSGHALSDCVIIDVFHPRRPDLA